MMPKICLLKRLKRLNTAQNYKCCLLYTSIGRAAAIAFAREGADIALHFFPGEEKDAEEVAHYIREAGRKVILLPADLRDKQAPEELVAQAREALGLSLIHI